MYSKYEEFLVKFSKYWSGENSLQVHAGVQLQQELACSTMTVVELHDYGRTVQSFLIQLLLKQNFVNNQYSMAF